MKQVIEIEMITVGEDGQYEILELSPEQETLLRARFHVAAHGERTDSTDKNPSTWTKEEYAAHHDKMERKLRDLK